ncbi:MAG: phasin family protein [Pseudomonadota bacterium]
MNQEFVKNVTEHSRKMYKPFNLAQLLTIRSLEKLTEYQLAAVKSYTELGLKQMKANAEMSGSGDASDFGNRQAEWVNNLSKQVLNDAKRLTDISNEIKSDMEVLMQDIMSTAAEVATSDSEAKPKTAPAAKKA